MTIKKEWVLSTAMIQAGLLMMPTASPVVSFVKKLLAENMRVRTWKITVEEMPEVLPK